MSIQAASHSVALEKLLIDIGSHHEGLRLHEYVQQALEHGFRGKKTGELTSKVRRCLQKLHRQGAIKNCPIINPDTVVA